ncbi:MAG: Asp-tRNA(Asn)/Glu-tRNA(Gln) amidotransferase subunit GatA [Candidatus Saganbacteria bacterium]|nr:Asp-tRNA(Asn)/Glu-tRNA(Gln) amidotransferase subunit GatA [Candidatus Saganbacteria bacterium]
MNKKTAHELKTLLNKKEISATEIVKSVYDQIEKYEDAVSAYVTLTKKHALAQAKEVDEGKRTGPLAGIPIAIKDNMCTKGTLTTCSSKILNNYIPPYNATIIDKLDQAGAIMIGKTNLDEFAMGSSTENSGIKTTRNPWNLDCVPGGSSGGSAAAVAADETILAVGSDTGGSIRQPASFCGIVGMKPTYGRISRYGLVAFASSLDQIGPMTKDVRDCALLLNIIAGYEEKDSTSAKIEVPDYTKSLVADDIKGITIGVIAELMGKGVDKLTKEATEKAIKLLESKGAKIKKVSLPHLKYSVATYYLIAPAEASSNLGRYDGVKYGLRSKETKDLITMYKNTRAEGFGPEVKRRILLGTYALSAGYYDAYYLKALKVRTLIKQDFEKAFGECEVLLSPTCPSPAFRVGEKANDPLSMYLSDISTIPVNLAGLPAISVPCEIIHNLPIGLQIIGKAFDEETILKVAFTYEQNTGWHKEKPKIL